MDGTKRHLIAGDWVGTGASHPNINPSDVSDIVGNYDQGGLGEAEGAIQAAVDAFPEWSCSTPEQRHDALKFVGDELLARKTELGTLLSREEGKILSEGQAEVHRAAHIFDFFAGEALRPGGELLPSVRAGIDVAVTREPIGPVGLITPWNYPMAIPAWKIAPARSHGNTAAFKPAELVPGSAWALADIIRRSPLPKGVFNMVMGPGRVAGQALLEAPQIRGVSFTGSQETGRRVAEASVSHMRRIQLEMGGKNPLVILDDADLDLAVDVAVNGAYFSTGQRCTASSRLIVTEGIHNRFVERLTDRIRSLRVGSALDPASEIGPVVDQVQLDQDLDYIAVGRAEGGNLRVGGEKVRAQTEGFYLSPALFTDTHPDMRINREEIFGPIATVIRVRDYDEALEIANGTEFGLSAGICTTSLKYAHDFRRKAQAGMVMVNLPTAGVDYHVPFGGMKASSFGQREQGSYAREFFTTVKTGYLYAR